MGAGGRPGAQPRPARCAESPGIAGNRVLSGMHGPSALARFDREVLVQSGVTHVFVLEGINDLGMGAPRLEEGRCRLGS